MLNTRLTQRTRRIYFYLEIHTRVNIGVCLLLFFLLSHTFSGHVFYMTSFIWHICPIFHIIETCRPFHEMRSYERLM
jgi:hypothetical protein